MTALLLAPDPCDCCDAVLVLERAPCCGHFTAEGAIGCASALVRLGQNDEGCCTGFRCPQEALEIKDWMHEGAWPPESTAPLPGAGYTPPPELAVLWDALTGTLTEPEPDPEPEHALVVVTPLPNWGRRVRLDLPRSMIHALLEGNVVTVTREDGQWIFEFHPRP